jgi:hypothetical protein
VQATGHSILDRSGGSLREEFSMLALVLSGPLDQPISIQHPVANELLRATMTCEGIRPDLFPFSRLVAETNTGIRIAISAPVPYPDARDPDAIVTSRMDMTPDYVDFALQAPGSKEIAFIVYDRGDLNLNSLFFDTARRLFRARKFLNFEEAMCQRIRTAQRFPAPVRLER